MSAATPRLSRIVVVPLGPPPEASTRLLGLTPAARLRLCAERAGVALHEAGAPLPAAAAYAVVPGDVLAERDWMGRLAGPASPGPGSAWSRAGDGLILLNGDARGDVAAALARGVAFDEFVASIEARRGPPDALPLPRPPLRLDGTRDGRAAAERRLMQSLVKDTDGFLARHVARPVSLAVSRRLAPTRITPNQMTLVTGAIGLAAAPFFLSSVWWLQAIGGALFLLHSILDGCDGELARLKFQESRWGGLLDFWSDNVVHVAVFGCMAVGWARDAGHWWPLLFGAGAVVGTIGAAGLVHWRVLRPKSSAGPLYTSVSAEAASALSGLLDGLSRRDFIYLVFALSLFGKAAWFLALAGVGTPVFLALLLFLAWRESRPAAGMRSAG